MLVPLYGFVRGDTVGLVVLVQEQDTIREVARVLQEAASVRVAPWPRPRLMAAGRELDPDATVISSGLSALDRVDLLPPAGEGGA